MDILSTIKQSMNGINSSNNNNNNNNNKDTSKDNNNRDNNRDNNKKKGLKDITNKIDNKLDKQKESMTTSIQKMIQLATSATSAITCGPECQKNKKIELLRQKYLDAQTNKQTAPAQLEQSEKNYFVYKEGQPYYNKIIQKRLQDEVQKQSAQLSKEFNESIDNAKSMINYLEVAQSKLTPELELCNDYITKNKELQKQIDNSHGDIMTNDRKSFYESSATDKLMGWYTIGWYIYYLLVLVFVLSCFTLPIDTFYPPIIRICLSVLFLFYPYYIHNIVQWVYSIYVGIKENIPKNVYNKL